MKRNEPKELVNIEKMYMTTPVGTLVISASEGSVNAVGLANVDDMPETTASENSVLAQAARELHEYFEGKRTVFTFPMRAEGTPFQKSVWNALSNIPFGELRTYGQIALEVENPKGSRAVGMACNKNPIMIAVPCHRVVGANGSLTGYAGGLPVKQSLLSLEQKSR